MKRRVQGPRSIAVALAAALCAASAACGGEPTIDLPAPACPPGPPTLVSRGLGPFGFPECDVRTTACTDHLYAALDVELAGLKDAVRFFGPEYVTTNDEALYVRVRELATLTLQTSFFALLKQYRAYWSDRNSKEGRAFEVYIGVASWLQGLLAYTIDVADGHPRDLSATLQILRELDERLWLFPDLFYEASGQFSPALGGPLIYATAVTTRVAALRFGSGEGAFRDQYRRDQLLGEARILDSLPVLIRSWADRMTVASSGCGTWVVTANGVEVQRGTGILSTDEIEARRGGERDRLAAQMHAEAFAELGALLEKLATAP